MIFVKYTVFFLMVLNGFIQGFFKGEFPIEPMELLKIGITFFG
jgi:hypothetical protein